MTDTHSSAPGLATAMAAASPPPPLGTPFEHIALAFSGGGFMAASFCLGSLSYLDHVTFSDTSGNSSLLEKIRYISSASGGTITSASFALACAEGNTFAQFFDSLISKLQQQGLLKRALEILNTTAAWQQRPSKHRNLINAFALSYDETLFHGATLADLQKKKPGGMNIPLEELCFNSTEFYLGLPFRQNTKLAPDSKPDPFFFFGNNYIHLDPAVAGKIRIADAMANSSCFPAGFEPMKFPDDLSYKGLDNATLSNALQCNKELLDTASIAALQTKGFGIMDGGITDNQGLEDLMLADARRSRQDTSFSPFDLIMVTDVGSQYMAPYDVPPINQASLPGRLNYVSLRWVFFALLPILTLILIWLGWKCHHHWSAGLCFGGAGLLLGLTILFFGVNKFIPGPKSKTGPLHDFSPDIITLLLGFFGRSSIGLLAQMISARVSSMLILSSSVFMKRIRQLIYDSFFQSPQYSDRRMANHIYDLSFTNDLNRSRMTTPNSPALNKAIQTVAQQAFDMPIALWFGVAETAELPALIACGQFTTCYNLLEYTRELTENKTLFASLDPFYQKRITDIRASLLKDWEKFSADPLWLFNQPHG